MNVLLNEAQAMEETLIAHRRYLHSHAEVGLHLPQTYAYVKNALEKLGYQVHKCGRCGLVAVIGTGKPVFLLRADMDALPIEEKADIESVAQNACMHACGHDMHTAMLLGAAALLKKHEKEIKGCVKLMFQPAEEPLLGARDMIENGVLENPEVNAGMMVHVMTGMPIKTGTAIIAPAGVSAPGVSMFEIHIQGRGGHGASPNLCIDPVNAAAHLIIALQALQSREMSTMSGALLTIGSVQAGDAPNVIADHAILRGSLRAYTEKDLAYLRERLQEIADLTARTFRAEARVAFTSEAPTLINDETLVKLAKLYLSDVLGAENVIAAADMQGDSRSSGSEDFAYVSQRVPTVMLALAAGDRREGYEQALHHPYTRFDEAALRFGAAAYAGMALRYLEAHGE